MRRPRRLSERNLLFAGGVIGGSGAWGNFGGLLRAGGLGRQVYSRTGVRLSLIAFGLCSHASPDAGRSTRLGSVSEIDFRGFPTCASGLVPEFGRVGWGGLVIVGWNPGADGLPRWFDGLEGLIRPPHLAGSPCGLRLSPASKTPPSPRRFSISNGGSGGGGRLTNPSHRPRRRRNTAELPGFL